MRTGCLLVLAGVLTGCSGGKPDTQTATEEIKRLLGTSRNSIVVPIGRVGLHCSEKEPQSRYLSDSLPPGQDADTATARNAGYVTVNPEGKEFWTVRLTDKGRAVMKAEDETLSSPQSANGCDYQLADFIVATPTLIQVTRVTGDKQGAVAEYAFKWTPTELGVALRQDGEIYSELLPYQRLELQYHLAKRSVPHGIEIPVPPEALFSYGSARFENTDKGWRLIPEHKS